MASLPVLLSVVFVVRNQATHLEAMLSDATTCVAALASDYELIVIDNASDDDSVDVLRALTGEKSRDIIQKAKEKLLSYPLVNHKGWLLSKADQLLAEMQN